MRTALAGLVLLIASALLVLGFVGLFTADDVRGMLVAGLVLIGGGALLVRLAGRIYLRLPSAFKAPVGADEAEAQAYVRELAWRQFRATAVFLLVLTVLYLLVGLFLVGAGAGIGAAAITALAAGLLGTVAWWQRGESGE